MSIKDIAELIYFVTGGPVVAGLLLYGLKQLHISKKQVLATEETARLQNKRDSLKVTIEQCEYYKTHIVEPSSQLIAKNKTPASSAKNKVAFDAHLKIKVELIGDSKIDCKITNDMKPVLEQEFKEHGKNMLEIANCCEVFSLYFTSGIADHQIAFRPCAPGFCKTVDTLIPYIATQHQDDKLFVNTLRLYLTWKKQLANERIVDQIEKLKYDQSKITIDSSMNPLI